jgi:hypothetical protein
LYQRKFAYYADVFGQQIESIFLVAWVYIFIWFATIGHFKALPQFFETMVKLLGIKM